MQDGKIGRMKLSDPFEEGRKGHSRRKSPEEERREKEDQEGEEVIQRVVERCQDRMDEAGYHLEVYGDTIYIHYKEDADAQWHDPRDEDEIENAPYYDEEKQRFYRFRVHGDSYCRKGWRLNKDSGIYLSEYDDMNINTKIDTSKPWEDELLRIIGEFVAHDSTRAARNREEIAAAKEREENNRRESEKSRREAEKRTKVEKKREAEAKKEKQIIAVFVLVVLIVAALLNW